MPHVRGKEVYEGPTQILPELSILGHWQLHQALPGELRSDAHRKEFEIHLVQEGCMEVWVDDPSRKLSVTGGCAMLTQPGQVHGGLREVLHPGRWFWLRFTLPRNGRINGLTPELSAPLLQALHETEPVMFAYSPALEHCFERLIGEHRHPSPEAPLMARLILNELLVWIARDRRRANLRPDNLVKGFSPDILSAIELIRANLTSSIAVEVLADQVNMGESNFRRRFARETGYSPRDYIMHLKMDKAMEMLSSSDRSVTDIAMDLGFATSAHFASVFRRRTGLTPSDYRAAHGPLPR